MAPEHSEPVDVYVCVTCRHSQSSDEAERSGRQFYQKLESALYDRKSHTQARVHPVECLAVCKRPCTVVVSSANKWTYLIGDLDASSDMCEFLAYIDLYAASEAGTPSLKERPQAIRKGTIARIPHLSTKT